MGVPFSAAGGVAVATERVTAKMISRTKRTRTQVVYKAVIQSGVPLREAKQPRSRGTAVGLHTFAALHRTSALARRRKQTGSFDSASHFASEMQYSAQDDKVKESITAYARSFPPKPSSALMICADHAATSSSRSVRSAD